MKRVEVGSTIKYGRHTDEAYEQELKSLLFKQSGKNKGRGLTSAGGGNHQGFGSHYHTRRIEHIERIVLETDTLPGLALLYNTTIADIKKLNHIYTEQELHARRTIKVPSRGILINLDDQVVAPSSSNYSRRSLDSTVSASSTHSINITPNLTYEDPEDVNANDLMTVYLNTKDNFLQEIREKADVVAANSPILNGSSEENLHQPQLVRRKGSTLKWWHLLMPCIGFIIVFPILLFLFQEHIFEHDKSNPASNGTDPKLASSPLQLMALSSSEHSVVKVVEGEHS